MIGAHDTFTYLNAQDIAINLFKKYWRCQKYSPEILYHNYGVRFFDIRLCKNTTAGVTGLLGRLFKKKKFTWATAHGLAEFRQEFANFEEVLKYMQSKFPEAQYRVVLERCSSEEVKEFKKQTNEWIKNDGKKLKDKKYNCSWIGIKKPWQSLYINQNLYPREVHDYCCRLFNWDTSKDLKTNIKNFRADYTLEKWAKIYNPILTKEQKVDPNVLYFADYIGLYGIR